MVKVLSGKHDPGTPLYRTLPNISSKSKVLLYMTGHGGDEFLKFHNFEEFDSSNLQSVVLDMQKSGRLGEMFYIVDTCQAGTMLASFQNNMENQDNFDINERLNEIVFSGIGSSGKDENSYAHKNDRLLGVALADRFTDYTVSFIEYIAHYNITHSFNPWYESSGLNVNANSGGMQHYKNRFKQIYYGTRGRPKRKGISQKAKSKSRNRHYNYRQILQKYKENLNQISIIDLVRSYSPQQLKSTPVYFSTKDAKQYSSFSQNANIDSSLGSFFSHVPIYRFTHDGINQSQIGERLEKKFDAMDKAKQSLEKAESNFFEEEGNTIARESFCTTSEVNQIFSAETIVKVINHDFNSFDSFRSVHIGQEELQHEPITTGLTNLFFFLVILIFSIDFLLEMYCVFFRRLKTKNII